MGKASSSKKVARAARAGGRSSGARQRNLLFPGVVGAIVLVGAGLVAYAANGIYVCGEWQPEIPEFENDLGIHTHGDGVIHIHPFSQNAAGEDATLGVFLEGTDVEVDGDELTIGENELTDGAKTWKEGDDQCDGEDAELKVAQWQDVSDSDAKPALLTSGFDDIRFREDGQGYTIAFVPEDETDIPMPETAANLAELGAVDADPSATTTTTGEGEGSTTTAGEGPTTTTAGGTHTPTARGGQA